MQYHSPEYKSKAMLAGSGTLKAETERNPLAPAERINVIRDFFTNFILDSVRFLIFLMVKMSFGCFYNKSFL